MKKKRASDAEPTPTEIEQWRSKALTLINTKRTMVLATCMNNTPWATPVYYLYNDTVFYFYSSANALHTQQALSSASSSAAIYADGNRLDQIEGLQMTGETTAVQRRVETLTVAARYLVKFPLAEALLAKAGAAIDKDQNINLYRFAPEKLYYMDNRSGFGKRLEIKL